MSNELVPSKVYVVGKIVYRRWLHTDRKTYWYEAYFVERLTPQYVFVRGFMEHQTIRLKRRALEKWGYNCSTAHSAVFYTEMPEEYRKTTIGYLMAKEPREILGLGESFTVDDLHRSYRRLAKQYHPDRNPGDTEAEAKFKQIQAAYERLSESASLGDIFRFMQEYKDE